MLGVAYKESGDDEKAMEAFRTALEKNKKDEFFYWVGGADICPIKEQIKTIEKLKK